MPITNVEEKVRSSMNRLKGFTFIELILLIFVVGVLAAIAIPLYINMSPDSAAAIAKDVRIALNSAERILYSKSRSHKSLQYTCENVKPAVSVSGISDFQIDCNLDPPSAKATIGDTTYRFTRNCAPSAPARWTRIP
jgi:Tfp pilus assembly protein PilE